jgi:hypothetical protein
MLEIIAIVLLSLKMGKLAVRKGLKKAPWVFYTVIAWIIGEVLGIFLSVLIFDSATYLEVLPMAIAGAVGGYLLIHYILNKKPDADNSFEFEQNDPPNNS